MNTVHVDRSNLEMSFDFVSAGGPCENAAYLCRETGKLYWHSELGDNEEELPEDVDDSSKYIPIPHKNDFDLGTPLVFDFVLRHLPGHYDEVRRIFRRRGAYGRYKSSLDQCGLLEQWYEFEEEAVSAALQEWCRENGVVVDS